VKIFDGANNFAEISGLSFLAYDASFMGGVEIAVGNLDGDPVLEIVTAPTFGVVEIRTWDNQADTFVNTQSFQAFPSSFGGGAVVEIADMGTFLNGVEIDPLNQDGVAEIVVGNGPGIRPTVHVFDTTNPASPVRTFLPFGDNDLGGVSIALGRINPDTIPDLIVGAGYRGGSFVEIYDGTDPTHLLGSFQAYNDSSRNAPLRIVGQDTDGDGRIDKIITAQGPNGATNDIKTFDLIFDSDEELDDIVLGSVLDLFSVLDIDDLLQNDPDFMGAFFLDIL
jgi:hypothetical protein